MKKNQDYQFFLQNINETIMKLKKQHGLSTCQLAQRLSISEKKMLDVENGKTLLTLEQLIDLAETFGLNMHEFMCMIEAHDTKIKEEQKAYSAFTFHHNQIISSLS